MPKTAVDLLLASNSPRRKELLIQMGVNFSVIANSVDESLQTVETPRDYVSRLALAKARGGFALSSSNTPVLGADTAVVLGQQIFGKPSDADEALSMLMALSARKHSVMTAVAVTDGVTSANRVSVSEVTFRCIETCECRDYVRTGEPMDKADGYAIQGFGGVFVEHLEGSYSGVVGLPIDLTHQLLRLFHVPIWASLS